MNNGELNHDLLMKMFFRIQVEEANNLKTRNELDSKMVNKIVSIINHFMKEEENSEI